MRRGNVFPKADTRQQFSIFRARMMHANKCLLKMLTRNTLCEGANDEAVLIALFLLAV
jgi:hypothetical protein